MILSVLILITTFLVYTRSFEDNVPSCGGYITNVYLYVALGLLLLAFSILYIAKRQVPITYTKSLLAFAVGLALLFALLMVKPEYVLLNHALWVGFIATLAVSLFTIWRYSEYRGVLNSTLIGTFMIVAALTAVAYIRPDLIKLSWGAFLTIALFGAILVMLVPMIFGYSLGRYQKLMSAGLIIFFSALILYDTKLLRYKAERCTIPDYPVDSMGLFLNIVNIFSNMAVLR